MKLISKSSEGLKFQLDDQESGLLRFILQSYPVGTDGWPQHPNSPRIPPPGPDPTLLADALRERKMGMKAQVDRFLEFRLSQSGVDSDAELDVPADHVEWLLQVLNEVRVGSWYHLGCPDEDAPDPDLDPVAPREITIELVQHLTRFHFSGGFLTFLLHCLDSEPDEDVEPDLEPGDE